MAEYQSESVIITKKENNVIIGNSEVVGLCTLLHHTEPRIEVKILDPGAKEPTKATEESAGYDLYALEDVEVTDKITPVRTGVAMQFPHGTYGQIKIRSGLAKNESLETAAGVIDSDYTGEIIALVYKTNSGYQTANYKITKGQRFAQIIPLILSDAPLRAVNEFSRSVETHSGFGSTGK